MKLSIELNTAENTKHIKFIKSDESDDIYIEATIDDSYIEILGTTDIKELEKIIALLKQVHPWVCCDNYRT